MADATMRGNRHASERCRSLPGGWLDCEDHGPSRSGHEHAPCRTTPPRFHDNYVPPTRHRGLASSERSAGYVRKQAQEEMHQDGALRWRTKIDAPLAVGYRKWRQAAIR